MKVKILGSGSSKGIPQAGSFWGEANPNNEKNKRTRSSILIEINSKNFYIDTGPDFRYHMNKYNISKIDALLYTHGHSDHIDGVSDTLEFGLDSDHRIKTYLSQETHQIITQRFADLFNPVKNHRTHDRLDFEIVEDGRSVDFTGEKVKFFEVIHGVLNPTAFRCGAFAYVPDFNILSPSAMENLKGLDVLLINANEGFHKASPTGSHSDFYHIFEINKVLKAKKVILNHISS
ncbi:MAG: MBL fold metallo-hydrolase [Alphaproteobacteria bacterium]